MNLTTQKRLAASILKVGLNRVWIDLDYLSKFISYAELWRIIYMNLTTQKRLAASILKVGLNRVWMDPERMEEISMAITREGVMQLINDGAIKAKPQKGISSYRSKKIAEQKQKGKRKGAGSRKGAKKARTPKKKQWMTTIRALRKDLKEMREDEIIDATTYRKLYKMAKGGAFRSKSYMRNYARDHDLIKGDE